MVDSKERFREMTQQDRTKLAAMEAQRSLLGWIKCPGCGGSFKFDDRRAWTGYRHSACGQRLLIMNVARQAEPVWCVVANVAEDCEIRPGTKHFKPGARVYCFPPVAGDGYENIVVIARQRGSIDFVEMVLPSKYLADCRAQLVYGPYLLDRLSGHWDGTAESKQLAKEMADVVNDRNAR